VTGTAAGKHLSHAIPPLTGGIDRVIKCAWMHPTGRWIAFAVLAAVYTVALLSVNRDATQGFRISEGRMVASTVKQDHERFRGLILPGNTVVYIT